MHSLISSLKFLNGLLKRFKPFNARTRHTRPGIIVVMLPLVLLISTGAVVSGQELNSGKAGTVEQGMSAPLARPEQFSDSNASAPVTDAATILRSARLIYVRKKSVYFKAPEFENELRKRPEFQRWGMSITRNETDADLIIEVGRKVFTTRFVYTVIDPRTSIVVASGKLSSLGGTLSTKLARQFIHQVQQVRP